MQYFGSEHCAKFCDVLRLVGIWSKLADIRSDLQDRFHSARLCMYAIAESWYDS